MDVRTLKAALAILAGVLLVGVLTLLVVESRAVKDEYYVAHAERMRALETTEVDVSASLHDAESAFEDGRRVPLSVELALARLLESNGLVQDLADTPRLNPELETTLKQFDEQIRSFVANGRSFVAAQNAFADALQEFQKETPVLVKFLRDQRSAARSQSSFSLAIDIIEYATGQTATSREQLALRIDELRNDFGLGPEQPLPILKFADAANSVLASHAAAEAALTEFGNSTMAPSLSALVQAVLNENRRTVGRAERARALLAVCAVILLFATAFAIVRLQSSYRELNQSNAKLAEANATLEDRVAARTEQLSQAYDELKESQVQLIHAEKMSSLGEMVAGISHEINTPLWYLMSNSCVIQERLEAADELCEVADSMIAAIKSGSSVKKALNRGLTKMNRLLKDGLKDDIDEAKSLIQDSIDGLDELTALAQSLKEFSRLDRARRGELNVNEGLDKTLLIAKNRIKNKATVHKHYGDVPPISCSPSQINQIFLNLLTNAADAIEDRGDIILHTWAENGRVEISIADTGCGIPADTLPKIRDPFFTTKEVGKGTGLGLSIVDRIVTEHGGELRIESEVGKGTIVTVTLPTAIPDALPPEELYEDTPAPDFAVEGAVLSHARSGLPEEVAKPLTA